MTRFSGKGGSARRSSSYTLRQPARTERCVRRGVYRKRSLRNPTFSQVRELLCSNCSDPISAQVTVDFLRVSKDPSAVCISAPPGDDHVTPSIPRPQPGCVDDSWEALRQHRGVLYLQSLKSEDDGAWNMNRTFLFHLQFMYSLKTPMIWIGRQGLEG